MTTRQITLVIPDVRIVDTEALQRTLEQVEGIERVLFSPDFDAIRVEYNPQVFRMRELFSAVAAIRFNAAVHDACIV